MLSKDGAVGQLTRGHTPYPGKWRIGAKLLLDDVDLSLQTKNVNASPHPKDICWQWDAFVE
jgi:hypothetical protein